MVAELRLIKRTGRDLLDFSIMRRSKIAIEVLLSLPGRIYGRISVDVRVHQVDLHVQPWNRMDVGLGVADRLRL
jgi:hypothetical protein